MSLMDFPTTANDVFTLAALGNRRSYRAYARDTLDNVILRAGLELRELPREALYLAGKVHQRYRQRGGNRAGVLSDFFIGAHAAVLKLPVLTRDTGRYNAYFDGLRLVAP